MLCITNELLTNRKPFSSKDNLQREKQQAGLERSFIFTVSSLTNSIVMCMCFGDTFVFSFLCWSLKEDRQNKHDADNWYDRFSFKSR